jgi:hypothetical protein
MTSSHSLKKKKRKRAKGSKPDCATTMRRLEDTVRKLEQEVAQLRSKQQQAESVPSATETASESTRFTLPDVFAGKPGEDPATWVFSCEQYFKLKPTDDTRRVDIAVSLLRESALLWWRMRCQDGEEGRRAAMTWSEFGAALQQQFTPVNQAATARARLRTLTQRTSVAEYAVELRELLLRLPRMPEDEKIDKFVSGLQPRIKAEVALKQPTTLDQAIRIADTLDSLASWGANGHVPRGTKRPAPSRQASPGGAPTNVVDKLQPLTSQEREQLRSADACFRCRQPGHFASECPKGFKRRRMLSGKADAQ